MMIKILTLFTWGLLFIATLNLAIPAWLAFLDGSNKISFVLDKSGQWEVITDIVLFTMGITLSIFLLVYFIVKKTKRKIND